MSRVTSLAMALLLALLAGPVAPSSASASATATAAPRDGTVDRAGRADPTDRWIVVYREGADVAVADGRAKGRGIAADRTYRNVLKGYAAKLTARQLGDTKADPDVSYVVRDEVVSIQAQSVPRGIRRTETTRSVLAGVDGTDERVDVDIAIFDTGIDRDHEDLNVVGGRNCATSSPGAWGDVNGHGTHVAGTAAALDNNLGVVGVAPGARLWSVRTMDPEGNGLVSWYVCGLDWLTAQREPVPGSETGETRPVVEVVNMSVARPGTDDLNCGRTNRDVIHQAICRLVASGVTVVAAAGNNSFDARKLIPASYNEVITVSALADTDGKAGGLGGNLCYSWGTYDRDDTFADFSNYGPDVDLIAPGKCTWSSLPDDRYGYISGTSMAAPHVAGAAALYLAANPGSTPAQVKAALQRAATYEWNTSTDPDGTPDRLLNVGNLVGPDDFQVNVASSLSWVNATGAARSLPVRLFRGVNVSDEVSLSVVAEGPLEASIDPATLIGQGGIAATLQVAVPPNTPSGTYDLTVTATLGDRTRSAGAVIRVDGEKPAVPVPTIGIPELSVLGSSTYLARASWGVASDATSGVAAYQAQWRTNGGTWTTSTTFDDAVRTMDRTVPVKGTYEIRVRARDVAGNLSPWVPVATPYSTVVIQDTSTTLGRSGGWWRISSSNVSGGTVLATGSKGAWLTRTFTGRGVSWIAILGSVRGQAQVWIDGALATTVDLKRFSTHYRRVAFSRQWSTSGEHTIRIVVLGTSGRPRVEVDALVVLK